eukprot:2883345-Amphidinium_carterae.1
MPWLLVQSLFCRRASGKQTFGHARFTCSTATHSAGALILTAVLSAQWASEDGDAHARGFKQGATLDSTPMYKLARAFAKRHWCQVQELIRCSIYIDDSMHV